MHPPTVEDLAIELDLLTRTITKAANEFGISIRVGISARVPTQQVEALVEMLNRAHDHSAWQAANHEGYRATILDSSACNPHPPGSPSYLAWHIGAKQAEEDTDLS